KNLSELERMKSINVIHSCANEMSRMMKNLIQYHSLRRNSVFLKEESFNLHKFLDEIEKRVRMDVKEKKIKIEFIKDANLPKYVIADAEKLHEVLNNLLSNALKFTDSGKIAVWASFIQRMDKKCMLSFKVV